MVKKYRSKNYNYNWNNENGYFERWGKDKKDNPDFSPVGPEILDIEISKQCKNECLFCYKSNNSLGSYMSYKDYKTIIDKMPNNLMQIALGIGDIDYNLDTLEMILSYTKSKGIIPNITINGYRLTNEIIKMLSQYVGAVSVSNYNKNTCYNAVELLTQENIKQVNIHQLVSVETLPQTLSLFLDLAKDKDDRLKNLNAVTFLLLKPKGNRNYLSPLSFNTTKKLITLLLSLNKKIGFDSCYAPLVLKSIKDKNIYEQIEPCESGLFSSYINVEGDFFPCSFAENTKNWETGISVLNCNDFLKDIWFNPRVESWRTQLINSSKNCNCKVKKYCRSCLAFPEINNCKEK